ncbi:hypothetical protein JB92DRAFT_3132383 [Gautieria morchelliformis]|nr:hypothetical protein JB92DRAFT_3132383 [Gautieria morchelliformis]
MDHTLLRAATEGSVNFRDPHYWLPDGKGLWQCQGCQDARWRTGPRARVHEDAQGHRRNVQYRGSSTGLQNSGAPPGHSDSAPAGRTSLQGVDIPEPGNDGWEDMSENASDGLAIGPVAAGPSWLPSGSNTLLERSLRESTVLELGRALDQYLGLRDVPAEQDSDDSEAERSQTASESSGGSSHQLEDSTTVCEYHAYKSSIHEASASEHRLNKLKRPLNVNLKKAGEILKKNEALKRYNKTDSLSIRLTFWCYSLRRKQGNGKPPQIQIPTVVQKFEGTKLAHTMINELLVYAESVYDKSGGVDKPKLKPSFLRENVVFAVARTVSDTSYLDLDTAEMLESTEALYTHLATNGLLSSRDLKERTITMQLRLYQEVSQSTKIWKSSAHRAHLVIVICAQWICVNVKFLKPQMAPHPQSDTLLVYDSYAFKKESFVVTAECKTIHIGVEDSEVETILIPQNWQRYINMGKKEGGYLGCSFVKFAFTGRIGGKEYAIFQDKNIGGITESTNQCDLRNELHLPAWGQYFLDSFFEQARKYGAKNIPDIKWNADDAFLGCLVEPLAEIPAHERSKQSLLYSTFLATPLLPFPVGPGGMEQKFSGNSEVGENTDHVGIWVDAYIPLLIVKGNIWFKYSDKRLVLFDPQAHIYDYSSGFWDKGPPAIAAFLKEHKCNKVCRQLGLHREIVPRKQVDGSTTSADAMHEKKGNISELDPLSKPDTVRSGKYLTLKELGD